MAHFSSIRIEEVASRPGTERAKQHNPVIGDSEHQDARIGAALSQLWNGGNSVHLRQPDVEQDNVWDISAIDRFDRGFHRGEPPAASEPGRILQLRHQRLAVIEVILDDADVDRCVLGIGVRGVH